MNNISVFSIVLKELFNKFAVPICEPISEGKICLDYNNGLTVDGLKIRPDIINNYLKNNGASLQVKGGYVGRLNMVYQPVPGTIHLIIDKMQLAIEPNTIKSISSFLYSTIADCYESPDSTSIEMFNNQNNKSNNDTMIDKFLSSCCQINERQVVYKPLLYPPTVRQLPRVRPNINKFSKCTPSMQTQSNYPRPLFESLNNDTAFYQHIQSPNQSSQYNAQQFRSQVPTYTHSQWNNNANENINKQYCNKYSNMPEISMPTLLSKHALYHSRSNI